ncbi:MAG: sodium:calcium antiporter [Halobacteriota archaeon]
MFKGEATVNPILFIASLAVIFAGSSLFTNGVEWVGCKFKLSEGVVGSVLAAIGTALPETIVPLIAIFFVAAPTGQGVGVGAILGAPFMLGTLALFVTGVAIIVFRRRRVMGAEIAFNSQITQRDLGTFLIVYLCAVGVALFLPHPLKPLTAMLFVAVYIVHAWRIFKANEGILKAPLQPLRFDLWAARLKNKTARQHPPSWLVIGQTVLSVFLIIAGARLFVSQIVSIAEQIHANATLLALVIAPIATELPEKLNSVLWVSQGKDTLALGNITGAMVFQSCIPVASGIAFTAWTLGPIELLSAALTLIAGIWTYVLAAKEKLTAPALFFNGFLYLLFLSIVLRG